MSRDTFPDLLREDPTAEVVGLLQHAIRNRGVNNGSVDSGNEARRADLISLYLGTNGLDLEVAQQLVVQVAGAGHVFTDGEAAAGQLRSSELRPLP